MTSDDNKSDKSKSKSELHLSDAPSVAVEVKPFADPSIDQTINLVNSPDENLDVLVAADNSASKDVSDAGLDVRVGTHGVAPNSANFDAESDAQPRKSDAAVAAEKRLQDFAEKQQAESPKYIAENFESYLRVSGKQPIAGRSATAISAGAKSASARSAEEPDEELLIYKPHAGTQQWLEYRFSAWNSFKAWFAMLAVVVFSLGGGPAWIIHALMKAMLTKQVFSGTAAADLPILQDYSGSFKVIVLFFGLIALTCLALAVAYFSTPTHVALSKDSVSLDWRFGKRRGRKKLAWSELERVDLVWPAGKTSPQDCQIKFKSKADPAGKYALSMKLGAIIKEADRAKLLKAIEKNAPNAQMDAKLLDVLSPAQDHSYTELWLQALSAPPKRERLTPLSTDSELFECRYKVIRQLGVGGQGTAYLAFDKSDAHEVVLKEFILPVYVDTNVLRQALERMQNEAAMLRKLDNDRIVRLNNFFVEDHRGYLVLEKIDGLSLEQIVIKEGPMSEERVASLAQQMCQILGYLHNLQPSVIHRDFTPDNLILGSDGILKLVDFNVAQQTESTATGTVVGKHSYISPEQFRGRPTPQSDIYAMGATLFYLLTAEAPEPIKVSKPKKKREDVSDALDGIVSRATAFDTAKRYARIEELEEDLNSMLEERTNALAN